MNHEQMGDHLKAVSRPALIVGLRTYLDEMRTNVAADGIPEAVAPGARRASLSIEAQTGLAVDVNHAVDYPGVSKAQHGPLDIGKSPSVSRGPNTNHVTFELITQAAREDGIPYQVSVNPADTGTDANAMQLNRGGMATGLLGVPLRYMHTPCELLSLQDVEDCVRLMAAYCRRVMPDTNFVPR